jgi:hypothetical protein
VEVLIYQNKKQKKTGTMEIEKALKTIATRVPHINFLDGFGRVQTPIASNMPVAQIVAIFTECALPYRKYFVDLNSGFIHWSCASVDATGVVIR